MFVSEIDWYAQPLFTNLVSGLLGAVIGSVLSTLGVAWSAFEVQKREFAKVRTGDAIIPGPVMLIGSYRS
jgi:hypothetical protein